MAGLKKTSKKDASSPNMVLLIALIMFILTSIGLGVFAYYGYDGQEKLRQAAKSAKVGEETMKEARDNWQLVAYEAMLGLGFELAPEQKTIFNALRNESISAPDKYKEVKPLFDAMSAENQANLKGFNAQETKYETSFKEQIKIAQEEAQKARAALDGVQKEYEQFKTKYEELVVRYEKDNADLKDKIKAGNDAALAAAMMTNSQFPALQEALRKLEDARQDEAKRHDNEKSDLLSQLARAKQENADLSKKLNDRSIGVAAAPQSGSGEAHALMLDVSRGLPLWDRPLGKITRVEPQNMLVYIDLGSKAGVRPDVSFNVFANGPGGKADKQLKGTIEVVRVINETTAACRITSLYDEEGKSYPVMSEGFRLKAAKAADSILREGDLIYNPFFNMHVFIAGSVNFTGYASDSPASQNLQLRDFIEQLRKQNVYVDGYVNLLNGQVEGNMTPKTRLLIRGDFAPINRSEQELARFKSIVESYQVIKRQAIDQGMFIVSAENMAMMMGFRSPQTQNTDAAYHFQPYLPWTGGAMIRRFDRAIEGEPQAPAAPAPGAEQMEKQ